MCVYNNVCLVWVRINYSVHVEVRRQPVEVVLSACLYGSARLLGQAPLATELSHQPQEILINERL